MTPEVPVQVTKALLSIDTSILTLVYEDLARPGVQQVGKALATVLGLGNTSLLPLKLFNEKAQLLFTSHMEAYRRRLANVPEEKIVEVAPELGVPIVEKLEKTKNKELSELYLNLLTSASVADTARIAHPRFVLLIESMAPDEVKILEYLWRPRKHLPFISVIANEYLSESASKEGRPIETILTKATVLGTNNYLSFAENSPLYLNNLTSLGLIEAESTRMIADKKDYNFLEDYYKNYIQSIAGRFAVTNELPVAHVTTSLGYYDLTSLGISFLEACSPKSE